MANFFFGNWATSTNITFNSPVNYTAQIEVTKAFDPEEPMDTVKTYDVPLGVLTNIDVSTATAVKAICKPLLGFKFTKVHRMNNKAENEIAFTDELMEFNFTREMWEFATNDNPRKIGIKTEIAVKRTFYFGNDVDVTGKPIKTGENSFTGVVTLYGAFDPENPTETPEKTFNVESGTELEILLTPSFSRGKIDLTVVDGFEFIGVNFPYEATFTNNTVSYNFPDYSYDDIPEDKEELDPLDEMNRYYVANTKSTGGIDPEPSDEPSTIANNYLVTKEELADFNKRIYDIVGFEKIDNANTLITEYISAIRIYPFILPPENLYNRGVIKIKRSELNTATIINSDIITVDLGSINITRKYNNALDFINVKPELMLPFCNGSISIAPEYLLGSTVNIQMKINIISGDATINLKSDLIDGIFEVKADSIGADYPFYGRSDIVQKTFEPNQAINNIVTAYVILETPIYTESVIKSKKEGLLTDVKGDVIIDRIKLNVLATTDEKDDLQYLLKNGVFIK